MATMTGARFLAETLHGYGVTHFFFMPVVIPEAMPEMERMGIARVMTHGEKAAAYMADGYARVRQGIGVCGAQSVGALNLAAGLQDAYLACSPVLALTGRLPQIRQDRNAYQEVDHTAPFTAVTKYSKAVTAVDHFPRFLRQAIREATTATPRPTNLELWGIFGGEVMSGEADLEIVVEEPFTRIPPFRPEPELPPVLDAIKLLVEAGRPIVVAGGGVTASGARRELVELSDRLQLPVITSLNAKETFPFDHPLAVGVSGQYSRTCANRALAEADLVFFVGSHTGGQVTNDWRIPRPGTRVVQLDIDPAELGRSFPISAGMQCDARAGLRKMLVHCKGIDSSDLSRSRAGWISRVHQLVREWRDEVAPMADSDLLPMRPERLCKELTRLLPDDAILVSDTGHSGIWTGTLVDLTSPDQSLHPLRRFVGMGHSGGHRRQVRRRRPARHLLHRRRRRLVPHDGVGHGAPLRHPNGDADQQQRLPEPGEGSQRKDLRRTPARFGPALEAHRRRLRKNRRVDGLLRDPGQQAERAGRRPGAGAGFRPSRRDRRQDPHRGHRSEGLGR